MSKTEKTAITAVTNLQANYSLIEEQSKVLNIAMIPEKLTALNQWVLSKNKVPVGLNHIPLDVTNPKNGYPFEDVCKHRQTTENIGFILGNDIVGVDIDHCIDGGKMSEIAQQIVVQ